MKPRSPKIGSNPISLGTASLCLNVVLMFLFLIQFNRNTTKPDAVGSLLVDVKPEVAVVESRVLEATTPKVVVVNPELAPSSTNTRSFLEIARRTRTDKVEGHANLRNCLEKGSPCVDARFEREMCRPWGHFYDSLYQRWLAPDYTDDDADPFQFLEIGFYSGSGFAAFAEFLPSAEAHSIELACLDDGKNWPIGNTAKEQRPELYHQLLNQNRLHCGSAIDYAFMTQVWTQHMRRPDAPPLKIVVDDASHQAEHMVISAFFWFPKIEPGGFLIVEDIQPIPLANRFRTQFLPQIMSDLHWCGHPSHPEQPFFDTLWPLLKSVSCEMHICIFERNDQPANTNLSPQELKPPEHALDYELALELKKTSKSLK